MAESSESAPPPAQAENPLGLSPEPAQLLQLLDSEIAHIRSEQQQTGWTLWGVTAALVATLWLLLDMLKTPKIPWLTVFHTFLAFSMMVSWVNLLRHTLSITRKRRTRTPRYHIGYQLSNMRLTLFLAMTYSVGLIALLISTAVEVARAPVIMACMVYVFTLVILYRGFRATHLRVAFEKELHQGVKGQLIFSITLLGMLVWPIVEFARVGPFSLLPLNVLPCQIAGLMIAAIELMGMGGRLIGTPPALNPLVEMRRDLVLGRASASAIAHRCDITLSGLWIEDVAQEYIADLQEALREVELQHGEVRDWLRFVLGDIEDVRILWGNEPALDKLETAIEECESDLDDLEDEFKMVADKRSVLQKERGFFESRLLSIISLSDNIRREYPQIMNNVDLAVKQLDEESARLQQEIGQAKIIVKEMVSKSEPKAA